MAQYTSEKLRLATYSNGATGKGIKQIINFYYAATSEDINNIPATSTNDWKTKIEDLPDSKKFDETNKYLWNFERITYTEGDPVDTDRVMIAVYSKDGRGINNVTEFYIISKKKPTNLPTSSDKGDWTKEGDGALPVPDAQAPYLWNYEIVEYTSGANTSSGPVCIGSYGNSITSVTEWYKATNKNEAPTEANGEDGGWVTDISKAGQGAAKPYLWNYEETTYSIGNPFITPITLLTSSPREVVEIVEYYQQLPSTSVAPNGVIWQEGDGNHNKQPTPSTGWNTTQGNLIPGNVMWNMEIIQYAAVDGEGKNLYTATAPAQVGYAGTNGDPSKDLNLLADSYFVTKKKDGTNSPSQIKFSTQSSGIVGNYIWSKNNSPISGQTSSTYTLSTSGIDGPITVKVERDGLSDSLTIGYLLEPQDGQDAISILLTNPAMSFNENSSISETTSAIVMIGTDITATFVKSAPTTADNNWRYTLAGGDAIDDDGIITINKPNSETNIPITITVYQGKTQKKVQEIKIWCSISTNGTSPYTISLDNDFCSIPASNNGVISTDWSIDIVPTVYLGAEPQDWEDANSDNNTNGLEIIASSAEFDIEYSGGTYKIKASTKWTSDRGTAHFILQKDGEQKAETMFEAIKQRAGAKGTNGTNGEYVYVLVDPNVMHRSSIQDLTCTKYKKIGNNNPTIDTTSGWVELQVDDTIDDTKVKLSNGKATIRANKFSTASKRIILTFYAEDKQTIIDKATINILDDGESAYYLYHNAASSMPAKPSEKNFDSYPGSVSSGAGWYKIQTEDSVYSSHKIATSATQSDVEWGPVTRLSGVLTNYGDLWAALNEQIDTEKSENGIYTLPDNKIGINADLIKTGALCVGDTPKFDENGNVTSTAGNVFYADVTDRNVYAGGWRLSENSFTSTETINEEEVIVEQTIYPQVLDNVDTSINVFAWDVTSSGTLNAYAYLWNEDIGDYEESACLNCGSILSNAIGVNSWSENTGEQLRFDLTIVRKQGPLTFVNVRLSTNYDGGKKVRLKTFRTGSQSYLSSHEGSYFKDCMVLNLMSGKANIDEANIANVSSNDIEVKGIHGGEGYGDSYNLTHYLNKNRQQLNERQEFSDADNIYEQLFDRIAVTGYSENTSKDYLLGFKVQSNAVQVGGTSGNRYGLDGLLGNSIIDDILGLAILKIRTLQNNITTLQNNITTLQNRVTTLEKKHSS